MHGFSWVSPWINVMCTASVGLVLGLIVRLSMDNAISVAQTYFWLSWMPGQPICCTLNICKIKTSINKI